MEYKSTTEAKSCNSLPEKWIRGNLETSALANKYTPRHPGLETQAKSRGPDMLPFQRSWNPIKANVFRAKIMVDPQNLDLVPLEPLYLPC